jgi:hypothetical protein
MSHALPRTLLSLALSATLMASPAWASEPAAAPDVVPVPVETPVEVAALDAPSAPLMLGLTPVMARAGAEAAKPQPLSFPLAAGLTYGMPLAVLGVGALIALPLGAVNQGAAMAVLVPVQILFLASFTSGYIYAGEPARGGWVLLGEYGVLAGSALVAMGISVLLFGGGQSAGFGYALIGGPIVLGSWIGYNVWKMRDLHEIIERKNREAGFERP